MAEIQNKEVNKPNEKIANENEQNQQQNLQQNQQQNQPADLKAKLKEILPMILRMMFFYVIYKTLLSNKVSQINNNTQLDNTEYSTKFPSKEPPVYNNNNEQIKHTKYPTKNLRQRNYVVSNLWNNTKSDYKIDFYLYVSEKKFFKDFNNKNALIWKQNDIKFNDWKELHEKDFEIDIPMRVRNNGTYYLHAYIAEAGSVVNPRDPLFDDKKISYNKKLITKYQKKKKVVVKKKLISNDENEKAIVEEKKIDENENEKENKIVSYWYPEIVINYLPKTGVIDLTKVHPEMIKDVVLTEDRKKYHPIIYMNDFWSLTEHQMEINKTTEKLPLKVTLYPISYMKYNLYISMDYSFKVNSEMLGSTDNEFDEIKRMLKETNPILLGITFTVSIVHSIFDFLAFRNDVKFWKNRKDMIGISFRTLLMNIGTQAIVFLYLLDNETSWMIIVSNGVELMISVWKIHKAVHVRLDRSGKIPKIKFEDRVKNKEVDKTNEYDIEAFKYFQYIIWPLLIGYIIYSLIYEEHKGWYSFIISTLVGFVYMFGFLSLLPQLFINYKLKSVEHMPWKTFMYKSLNTFIDDLFAIVIKMPTLHRIACLRDDVVFFVYLYQRWIYPVDHTRRNEFGQVDEKALNEKLKKLKENENEVVEKEAIENVDQPQEVDNETKKDK